VDVGSSAVGASVLKLVKGYLTCLTFDMAFVLEAQNEEELPEVCLGTLRFSNVDLRMAQKVNN
jgi:Protein ENHANCED DISEASE RESISTANCE 2, C-terminal